MRLKQRSKVLLPQPDGPIRAVILLRGMSIVMSLSASAEPYQTERPRVESTTGSSERADSRRRWLRSRADWRSRRVGSEFRRRSSMVS